MLITIQSCWMVSALCSYTVVLEHAMKAYDGVEV